MTIINFTLIIKTNLCLIKLYISEQEINLQSDFNIFIEQSSLLITCIDRV